MRDEYDVSFCGSVGSPLPRAGGGYGEGGEIERSNILVGIGLCFDGIALSALGRVVNKA